MHSLHSRAQQVSDVWEFHRSELEKTLDLARLKTIHEQLRKVPIPGAGFVLGLYMFGIFGYVAMFFYAMDHA